MNTLRAGTYFPHRKEWTIAVLLFFFGFLTGLAHFEALRGEKSAVFLIPGLYGPAVMMASGHGFIVPDYVLYPELHQFLEGDKQSFSPASLPANIEQRPSAVASYHRYLLYAVALIWRIFGISWKNLEPFISLFLGWYAVSLYFLFRFFLSRILAFLCALFLTVSPAVFMLVLDLRDFSKAPFTITLFCILLWLLISASSLRYQIRGALLLGIFHGIFMGFRQDALIFLPLSMCVLIFPVFLKTNVARFKSLSPLLIYLSLFAILATPLLQHMEGGSQPQHVLVQGFARDRMDLLGMKEAAYHHPLSGADYYTFSMLSDFASRNPGQSIPVHFDDENTVTAGQRWLKEAIFLHPADLASRGWSAIWRILRYADAFPPSFSEPDALYRFFNQVHRYFAFFMHRAGLPLAILAFFLVALKSPLTALFIFLFTSYILGYTALQVVCRHTFHLSFFPFLIAGFLIETVIKQIRKKRTAQSIIFPLPIKRYTAALATLLFCTALILVPIPFLRWYQTRQLAPLFENAIQSQRSPLVYTKQDRVGWTFFSLETAQSDNSISEIKSLYRLLAASFSPELRLWNVRTRYLMAEFDGSCNITHLMHCYDSKILNFNFSQLLRVPKTEQTGKVLRYFFPVYELFGPGSDNALVLARGHFSGIAIPKEFSSHFRGLYEVHPPEDLSHLIAFTSLDDKIPSPLFYTPACRPDPVYYHHTEHEKVNNTLFSQAARRFGSEEQSILFTQAELILSTDPTHQIWAAQKLINLNRLDESLEGILEIKTTDHSEREMVLDSLELIAKLSLYNDETEHCLAALDALEIRAPERKGNISLLKIEACERAGMRQEALELYKDYLRTHPEDTSTAARVHALLSDGFSSEEKQAFWLSLTDQFADQAHFHLYLAMALDLVNKESLAKESYARAFALDPENPKIRICHTLAQADKNPIEETVENIQTLAADYPDNDLLIFEHLEREAFYLSEKEQHQKAGTLLLLAADCSDDPDRLTLKAYQQFTGAGDYEKAEKGLLELLQSNYGEEAAQALYVTIKLSRDFPERVNFWLGLLEAHPDNSQTADLLYLLHEERVHELFSSAALEELGRLKLPQRMSKEQRPILQLYQTIARYLEGQEDLDSIQRNFFVTEEEKALVTADLESLASALTKEERHEQSARLAALMAIWVSLP